METEGVTKFRLNFRAAPPPDGSIIAALNAWRTVLHRLELVSLNPERYSGVGFGNVSVRAGDSSPRAWKPTFLISGTQTGGIPVLTEQHYCQVVDYDVQDNFLVAEGPVPPSSESLTHAAIYQAAPEVLCVIHAHSPEIWQHADALHIPSIDAHIAYGTPDMAVAVGALAAASRLPAVAAMRGHLDGIIAYGASIECTALTLIANLAQALQREAEAYTGLGHQGSAT